MSEIEWPWRWPAWAFMSPVVRFDIRADNWDYSPMTEWGQGDLRVERRVHRDVASYGRQLGILTEAVIELADSVEGEDGPKVERLKALAEEIEQIKAEVTSAPPALREI